MNRRRTGILDVGEPTLNVGEQTVGETTSGRNDRLPGKHVHGSTTAIEPVTGTVSLQTLELLVCEAHYS